MKPTKQRASEALEIYHLYWDSYSKGDLESFAGTLDETFEMIGTSASEICHTKTDGIQFLEAQIKEVVDKVEMRNRQIDTVPINDLILVNERCDLYVLTGQDWNFYSPVRISSLLKETRQGWKVVQQHGSLPDVRVQEGETIAFEKISKENRELRDAVKRATAELENKNRELAIGAAVEKVRAVAMGMKKPEDMLAICRTISKQLQLFGVTQIRNIQTAIIDEEKGIYLCYQYFTPYDKEAVEKTEYLKSPVEHGMVRKMLASENAHFTNRLTGNELEEFREHRKAENYFPDPLLDEAEDLSYCFLSIGQGGLGLTLYQPLEGATLDLFKRFHQVFSLAYQRFRDINKSEAHAREIEIELALERVRAQTMAMHNSEDVGKCIVKMFSELTALGVDEGTRFGIGILNHDNENIQLWTASKDGEEIKMHIGNLHMSWHPLLKSALKAWKAQVPLHQYVLEGEDLVHYYQMINNAPDYKLRIDLEKLPEREFHYGFVFDQGFFYAFNPREFQPDLILITKRFSSLFEQTYRRYLDLVKAEAQAREAQIEAALERVRSSAMAMHTSEGLLEVIHVLREQMAGLGEKELESILIHVYNDKKEEFEAWYSYRHTNDPNGKIIHGNVLVHWTKTERACKDKEKYYSAETDYSIVADYKMLKEWYEYLEKVVPEVLEYDETGKILIPDTLYYNYSKFSGGAMLLITNKEASDDSKHLLKRSAEVFNLAYTRFLDLQKAESQAREAQIEAALERVRARSMSMHKSEELLNVITVVSEQLQHLNFKFNTVSFAINNQAHDYTFWFAIVGDPTPIYIQVPYLKNPMFDRVKEVLAKGTGFYADTLAPEESSQWHQHMFAHAKLPSMTDETKAYILRSGYARSIAIKTSIMLIVSNYAGQPYSDEENNIIKRFATVFEQSYTRFLDLQHAEAQAREAKIEAALERVRGKAMAMHSSEDLTATISAFYHELELFSITPRRCGVGLLDKQTQMAELSTMNTTEKGESIEIIGRLKMTGHPVLEGVFKNWLLQKEYHPVLRGNEIKEYYQLIRPQVAFPEYPNDAVQYGYFFFFPEGGVYAWTEKSLSEDELKIYRRFTTVLSLTYKRYKDLKDAEIREKEAIKQAALDRVRADIASMRSTADLDRITPLIWKELTTLGIPFIRCGVFIMDDQENKVHTYLSAPDGRAIAAYHTPMDNSGGLTSAIDHWRQQKVFVTHWVESDFQSQAGILMKHGSITSPEEYLNTLPKAGFHLHFLPFRQGMLYVGSHEPLHSDALQLVRSLADAFSVAYARYEDFTRLELAKSQIEKTLTDLKQTQTQLIQSEKMASLGELTAGIAHEIQNPLNFVNNFSEVSNELIDEMNAEIEKGDMAEAKAIAKDIKQNLEKILHHGKRADGIVKGMLQHSRSSSSTKEPTDINKLVDEYLRLAYHGLRAKDKSFNAILKTDYGDGIDNIHIIAQDIGRVVLNLITNAFYTVAEKNASLCSDGQPYAPTVSVRTKKVDGKVEIVVADNGNGIPQNVLDKIFQPFFTTKPTGQGTGLGLSLSYDIVKAHGGEFKLKTKESDGSEFTIILPIVKL